MMTRVFFILLLLTPLIVDAHPVRLKAGMSFLMARKLLIQDKWQPVNLHKNDDYVLMGVEHELFDNNFKEFESCSIDYSNCIMHYSRGRKCLTLYTIDEKIKHMKVAQWSNDCPAPKKIGQLFSIHAKDKIEFQANEH